LQQALLYIYVAKIIHGCFLSIPIYSLECNRIYFARALVKGKWTLLRMYECGLKIYCITGRRAKILLFGNKVQSWRNGINDKDTFFFATCFATLFDNTSFGVSRAKLGCEQRS